MVPLDYEQLKSTWELAIFCKCFVSDATFSTFRLVGTMALKLIGACTMTLSLCEMHE